MKFNKIRIIRVKDWNEAKAMPITIRDGILEICVPEGIPETTVYASIKKHRSSIEKSTENTVRKKKSKDSGIKKLSEEEIFKLAQDAVRIIPNRAKIYAEKLRVTYRNISIRNQKTRWGSCSNRGNLNFNCALMLTPIEVIDSVVVHELCHLKHMNHSKNFYNEVLSVYPDYYKWNKWLKDNEKHLISQIVTKNYVPHIWKT